MFCINVDRPFKPKPRLFSGFLEASEVDVIVACQPVISDGRLAPVLAQQWNNCLVFLASPEEQTGEMISGNSLVSPIDVINHLLPIIKDLSVCTRLLSSNFFEKTFVKLIDQRFIEEFLHFTEASLFD